VASWRNVLRVAIFPLGYQPGNDAIDADGAFVAFFVDSLDAQDYIVDRYIGQAELLAGTDPELLFPVGGDRVAPDDGEAGEIGDVALLLPLEERVAAGLAAGEIGAGGFQAAGDGFGFDGDVGGGGANAREAATAAFSLATLAVYLGEALAKVSVAEC
jgi:hypothetical protein